MYKDSFFGQATVMALGALVQNSHQAMACPILVSDTCKQEKASWHGDLLCSGVSATVKTLSQFNGHLYCICTDGEAKRGSALWSLLMNNELDSNSLLYKELGHMSLMNLNTGDDDQTLDKDAKHVFKWICNTFICNWGMDVFGTTITPGILECHLLDSRVNPTCVQSLLQPNDKQDVPLAFSFLLAVSQLSEAPNNKDTSYMLVRHVINLVGKVWMWLLTPYTNCNMSLHDQLISLSKAAYMILILYIKLKSEFLSVQLYTDIMHTIKNVYFSVAKTKVDNPDGEFHLVLLGTDCLEVQFGLLRSMVENDSIVDILQVASRLVAALESSMLLSLHPEWDKGPRCLHLPSLEANSGNVSTNMDHLSPASWKGDVSVQTINLQTCWAIGHAFASSHISSFLPEFSFAPIQEAGNIDILQPFGELIQEGAALSMEDED